MSFIHRKGFVTLYCRIFLALFVAMLVACGDSSDNNTPTTATGTLTSSNAARVADETLAATTGALGAIEFANPDAVLFGGVVRQQSQQAKAFSTRTSTTLFCGLDPLTDTGNGSFTYGITGDTITITFNSCQLAGATLNGDFTLSNIIGSQNPGVCPTASSFSVAFNNFSYTDATTNTAINGGYDYTLIATDSNNDLVCDNFVHTLKGASLTIMANGETSTLSNFTIDNTINLDTGNYTTSHNLTLSSTAVAGTVNAQTTTPISGNIANAHPDSGAISITDGTAIVTITINSNVSDDPNAVTITFDTDGNGTPEETKNYSWDALAAL